MYRRGRETVDCYLTLRIEAKLCYANSYIPLLISFRMPQGALLRSCNGENVSSITQVFDTTPELTMLSPARPEKTNVHSLPIVKHSAPTGHAQSHPVTHALKRGSCQSISVQKFSRETDINKHDSWFWGCEER